MSEKTLVHLYTGDGPGKTRAALGLALRSVGHGKRVVMAQFLKGRRETGEFLVQEKLAPLFEVRQFGGEGWVDLEDPAKEDRRRAREGMEFARGIVKEAADGAAGNEEKKAVDVLILDEVNNAAGAGMVGVDEILELIEAVPEGMVVVLTGRNAPQELVDRADVVTETREIKFEPEMGGREGVEF